MNDTSPRQDGMDQPGITVFLLDDHEVVRGACGICSPRNQTSTWSARPGRWPPRWPGCRLRPKVAVLDVRLPDGDGVSVCREIHSSLPRDRLPDAHVIRR